VDERRLLGHFTRLDNESWQESCPGSFMLQPVRDPTGSSELTLNILYLRRKIVGISSATQETLLLLQTVNRRLPVHLREKP